MKFSMESARNRIKSCICEMTKKIKITHKLDYDKAPIYLHDNVRLNSCKKESDTVRWIEGFAKDDVVFDIGANVGAYSLIMAKYAGKVYAFEPSSFTFSTLIKNVHTNRGFNIVPLNIAVSRCKKMGFFSYSSTELGSSLNSFGEGAEKEAYKQEMLSYSIDEFVEDFKIDAPNHIKLDVDGIEFEILKGAAKTISTDTFKSLMVEASDRDQELFDHLKKLGLVERARYDLGADGVYNYLFVRNI